MPGKMRLKDVETPKIQPKKQFHTFHLDLALAVGLDSGIWMTDKIICRKYTWFFHLEYL